MGKPAARIGDMTAHGGAIAVGCPTVLIGGMPALNNTSKCMCMWAGVISITVPGQVATMIA